MDETVGSRIRAIAAAKGLGDGAELAKKIPVSYETLRRWMTGETAPNRARQKRLEELLGVPISEFMLGVKAAPPPDSGVDRATSHAPATMRVQELKWEQIVAGAELDEEFKTELPDDSCAPDFPRGHWIVWSTTRPPAIGKLVLVRDQHGQLHARKYRQGRAPGEWTAAPVNEAYAEFKGDELAIVATYRGNLEP